MGFFRPTSWKIVLAILLFIFLYRFLTIVPAFFGLGAMRDALCASQRHYCIVTGPQPLSTKYLLILSGILEKIMEIPFGVMLQMFISYLISCVLYFFIHKLKKQNKKSAKLAH